MTVLYKTIKLKLIKRQKVCFPPRVPVIRSALWDRTDEGSRARRGLEAL